MLHNFHMIDLHIISLLNQIYIEHYIMFIVQFFHIILYIDFVIRRSMCILLYNDMIIIF